VKNIPGFYGFRGPTLELTFMVTFYPLLTYWVNSFQNEFC